MPRSPRATMMPPPAAWTISSGVSAASRFSILAISGMSAPSSWTRDHRPRGPRSALRTKETASRSMPCSTAKSTQDTSSSVTAGRLMSAPGRLRPLWEESAPPTSTSQRTSSPATSVTRRRIVPSARKAVSPGCRAAASPGQETETRSASPADSCVVSVKGRPASSSTTPPAISPIRSFGPGRSPSSPTSRPARSAAWRASSIVSACSCGSPWAKLSRSTSAPAAINSVSVCSERLAGPIVATIFVRRVIAVQRDIGAPPV